MLGSYGALVFDDNVYKPLVAATDHPTDIAVAGTRTAVITSSGAWFRNHDTDPWSLLIGANDHPRKVALWGYGETAVITDSGAWIRWSDTRPWNLVAPASANPVDLAIDGWGVALIKGTTLWYTPNYHNPLKQLTTGTRHVSLNEDGIAIVTSAGAYDSGDGVSWHQLAGAGDATTSLDLGTRNPSETVSDCPIPPGYNIAYCPSPGDRGTSSPSGAVGVR